MNPLAYVGSTFTAGSPVEIITKDRDPSPSDKSFRVGDLWFNRRTRTSFIFQGTGASGAVWETVENPKGNFDASGLPGVNDDSTKGFGLGSPWLAPSLNAYLICIDATPGAAQWLNVSSGGGGIPPIGSSTDDALVRWDGVGGSAVQNSNATLTDAGALTLAIPLAVSSGGTGSGSLTSGGVLLGNGASALVATPQPTNGQVLIGSTGLAPAFGTLTAGANISIANGPGTVTISATGVGTGDVVGPASATNNALPRYDGVTGKLIKNSGVTIDDSANIAGVNNLTVGGAFSLTADQVQVSEGGTGVSSFPANTILYGNGSGAIQNTGALANGQLLIGSFGNPPAVATLTAGANISITNGAGSITIASTASGGLTYQAVAGTSQAMDPNTAYQNDNAALTTFTLPATAPKGSRIELIGFGAGGWIVAQAAGQSVIIGTAQTTVGVAGNISSSNRYDNIEMVCVVEDATWKVVDMQGNINYV
jgi:hypothetical protein